MRVSKNHSARFMGKTSRVVLASLALFGMAAVAACSSTPSSQGSSSAAPTTAKKDPVEYTFVYASPGSTEAIVREAMKNLDEKYGTKGEYVTVADSEVAVSGLASNKFQFTTGVAATVMQAQQNQNAPVTFIGDIALIDWMLVAKKEITSCADLKGVRMGLHSPGGVSTAIYKAWFEENCKPADAPKILYIAGSPNRFQGLMADQLDATMLQLEDTLDLPSDKFQISANFAKDLSWVKSSTLAVTDEFRTKHPEIVQHFLEEILLVNRKVNEDSTVLAGLLTKWRAQQVGDRAEILAKANVDAGIYSKDGAMAMEDIQKSIELYVAAGSLNPGLKAADIADRQYLDAALAKLK